MRKLFPAIAHHLCVMKQPIQQCGRQDIIAQQMSPFRETGVRGENGRSLFVAIANQLEKGVGLLLSELRVPNLINDKQARREIAAQPLAH